MAASRLAALADPRSPTSASICAAEDALMTND